MLSGFLTLASNHARLCLVIGLSCGLLFPSIAAHLVPWLPMMVAGLLTLTALRIGYRAAMGALGDLGWGLASVTVLQTLLPLLMWTLLSLAGLAETPAALAIILTCSAPAITGSVNLALLLKQDAGRMMQILVLGTAAFPLTILPVLAVLPQLGGAADVSLTAFKLLVVIILANGLGFALRAWLFPDPSAAQVKALDGASVLAFSFIAVALLAALTPAFLADPMRVVKWAALAFAIGYLLQLIALLFLRRSGLRALAGPLALGAGNRNIAIFLIALSPDIMAPLMVFIGCWQLPMYLTPILLPRLYSWALRDE